MTSALAPETVPTRFEKGFAIATLFCFSGAIQRAFMQDGGAETNGGNPLFQVLWFAVYGLTLVFLLTRTRLLLKVAGSNLDIVVFLLYVSATVFWSQEPQISVRKLVGVLGPTLFAFYLVCRFGREEILDLAAQALGLAALGSLVFGLLVPQSGIMHEEAAELSGSWCGLFTHKNLLGQMMLGSVMIHIACYRNQPRPRYLLGAVLSALMIFLSRSSTSITLLAVVLALVTVKNSKGLALSLILSCAFLALGLFGSILVSGELETMLQQLFAKDLTFTGRDQLWILVNEALKKERWFGFGYGAFWLGLEGESGKINSQLGVLYDTAHNGYIDLSLEIGLAGVGYFLLMYLSYFVRYTHRAVVKQEKAYFWGFMFLVIQLTYNMIESNFMRQNNIYWVLLVTTIAGYKLRFIKVPAVQSKTAPEARALSAPQLHVF